jgi:hypothetical protein
MFCAVGTSDRRAMTSTTGIEFDSHYISGDSIWNTVCWSEELGMFVAVASSGSHRIMYSYDGTSWVLHGETPSNGLLSVCWSPELSMFVATANNGSNNRVVTTLLSKKI